MARTPVRLAGPLVAAAWGAVAGWWMPRGPQTATEGLLAIGVSLAAGFAAGRLSRSRWIVPVAPALFVVALELTRMGYRGPSVDRPRLTELGLLALLAGRGVYALVTVLPLVAGAAYGAAPARNGRGGPVHRWIGRLTTGALAVLVALVAAGVAWPARTPAIPGGVADLEVLRRGEHRFGLMIRGARPDAPVLLFVPGSPGGSEVGALRRHLAALEQRFVVATVDRRGGGKSYAALDPLPTFTVADETATVVAVAEHLRTRFRRDRIILVAHSGGTIPATFAVQQRPDLFRAYVGVAQAADPTSSDRAQYADTVAWARANDRADLLRRLADAGPPPYDDVWSYEPMILAEGDVYGYDTRGALLDNFAVPEHSLLDKVHVAAGLVDSYDVYYPRAAGVGFRAQVPSLAVPVYFVAGAREVPGRTRDLRRWYALLRAPHKEIITIPDAGHRSLFEQPESFLRVMDRVSAETSG